MAKTPSNMLALGTKAPYFELKNPLNGKTDTHFASLHIDTRFITVKVIFEKHVSMWLCI